MASVWCNVDDQRPDDERRRRHRDEVIKVWSTYQSPNHKSWPLLNVVEIYGNEHKNLINIALGRAYLQSLFLWCFVGIKRSRSIVGDSDVVKF